MRYAGKTLVNLYDLLIFGPLWLENTHHQTFAFKRAQKQNSLTPYPWCFHGDRIMKTLNKILLAPVVASLAMLSACSDSGPTNSGVYLLLDTSGTYTEELSSAEQSSMYYWSRWNPVTHWPLPV